MARQQTLVLPAHDGTELFVRFFRGCVHPTLGCGCPTVVLVHGLGEHSGRYQHVAERLTQEQWNVVAFDQRGHGRSGGRPTHVKQFTDYLQDLDRVWEFFDIAAGRSVLCGHSFGGLVSARYAQTRAETVDLLVLLSPLLRLRIPINPLTLLAGHLCSKVFPTARFRSHLPRKLLTHDPQRLEQRQQDPLIHDSITAGWFFQMRKGLTDCWTAAPRLRAPVLVCQAGADALVDPTAAVPFLRRVGSRDKTIKMYPHLYHELLNEIQWQVILEEIIAWIQERFFCNEKLRRCA